MVKLNSQQNLRFKRLTAKTVVFLIVGIIYFFVVLFTDFKIPCIVNFITGKLCPGCGTTRMIMALSQFDFQLAMKSNAYVLFFLPIGIVWGVYRGAVYIRNGMVEFSKTEQVCLIVAFALIVAFTIMRNMAAFDYLRP